MHTQSDNKEDLVIESIFKTTKGEMSRRIFYLKEFPGPTEEVKRGSESFRELVAVPDALALSIRIMSRLKLSGVVQGITRDVCYDLAEYIINYMRKSQSAWE